MTHFKNQLFPKAKSHFRGGGKKPTFSKEIQISNQNLLEPFLCVSFNLNMKLLRSGVEANTPQIQQNYHPI